MTSGRTPIVGVAGCGVTGSRVVSHLAGASVRVAAFDPVAGAVNAMVRRHGVVAIDRLSDLGACDLVVLASPSPHLAAVSALVEEMYRSNAGVVGPKLVHWQDVRRIQSVGIAVDRLGVEMPLADDGEVDQEQHDIVQDVFELSSACLMVRADLFRSVEGFNPQLATVGADLDFCWRIHLTGARVVIVPSAERLSGSGMIPSTTPSATCSGAVMRRARAAAGAFSEVRKRIAAHPSGLITE
mgnify:CR=1 FL=1